jgi:hypothetical protein
MEITVILAVAGLTAVRFTRMKMPMVCDFLFLLIVAVIVDKWSRYVARHQHGHLRSNDNLLS